MHSPRRHHRWLTALKASPLLGLALAAAVWFSVPSDMARYVSSNGQLGKYWLQSTEGSEMAKEYGLDSGLRWAPKGFEEIAQGAWQPLARMGANPSTNRQSGAIAALDQWERANHARVWAWETPEPGPPPLFAQAIGSVKLLDTIYYDVNAEREPRRARLASDCLRLLTKGGLRSVLPDAAGYYPRLHFTPVSGGGYSDESGGSDGGMWYSQGSVLMTGGGRIWQAIILAPGDNESQSATAAATVSAMDPTAPGFTTELSRIASRDKIDVWVLGPIVYGATSIRAPQGHTLVDAQALGSLLWPPAPKGNSEPGMEPYNTPLSERVRALSGTLARLAGGTQGFLTTDSGASGDAAPQGLFLAVYNHPAPTWQDLLRTSWRRWYWLHFQEVLGAAIGVLGLTLILSPVAFIRERRLIARERVREHLALMRRDAHDKVFNRLSALSKRVAGAGAGLGDCSSAALLVIAEDIRGTVGELQEILGEEVRHTRGALTTMPLAEQLVSVCEAQATRLGVEIECASDGELPEVEPMLGWDLQCIAEEAIANAVRHGGASRVQVSMRAEESTLVVAIADNGSGSPVLSPENAPEGATGLLGISDRLAARGGAVALELTEDGGTLLTVRVPLAL